MTYKSETLLSLGQSRVGPEQDALVKVSHCLVHLVQQDLQLRGNGDKLKLLKHVISSSVHITESSLATIPGPCGDTRQGCVCQSRLPC